ncbi:BREX system ATP-binding domain-containing protein [Desulfuribacillus alkaliarsenatis]|uniref:ATPase domain-containing protein n=1 Tax=Desulfuribacillus alkaliarsenatis TaxID=766136 RepID=A0A1E5FZ12_9FIRM|nr:BREX system ATP-binding domain-containing protein [Desulfuribacillus alkaliarsenatis]OEF95826.1 hypothetical protein BHF68_10535 [Desulfuribacillus alkaliarsenatis]
MTLNSLDAKKIISALKSGVVPNTSVESLLVSREPELAELNRCLQLTQAGNGVTKFISGAYGSGKTFLLHSLHQQAIDDNFIVARMQLNQSFTMNKWADLYRQAMHNLSVESAEVIDTGFEEMFKCWLTKLQSYENRSQAFEEISHITAQLSQYHGDYARAFIAYIRAKIQKNQDTSLAAASWIKGETNMPAKLKAEFGIKGQVDRSNALLFLKTFTRLVNLLKYNGLVILIDELETAMHQRSDIRHSIYENLRYIVDGTSSGEFPNCLFVFVGTDDLFKDSEKGICTYGPLAQRLRISDNDISLGFRDLRQPIIHLRALEKPDIDKLTQNILAIHKQAYNWSPEHNWEAIRNWSLFNCRQGNELKFPINTRTYIQNVVDILDTMEQGTNLSIFKMPLNLVENNGGFTFVPRK